MTSLIYLDLCVDHPNIYLDVKYIPNPRQQINTIYGIEEAVGGWATQWGHDQWIFQEMYSN